MLDASTQMRLTGLATGLDTDAIIKNLGKAHNVRIEAVKRDRQLLLWRQEAYRSTISMAQGFLKNCFNTANPASNFRSVSAFAKFSYNLTLGNNITDEAKAKVASIVSVKGTGDLKNFNQTIESVAQLATKDTWKGGEIGIAGITTKGFDAENFVKRNEGGGIKSAEYAVFTISIDGVSRTIQLDGAKMRDIADAGGTPTLVDDELDFSGVDKELQAKAFAKALDEEITKQFGKDYKDIVKANGNEVTFKKAGSTITLSENTAFSTLETLGLKGGATSSVGQKKIGDVMGFTELFGNSTTAKLMINDKTIDISKDDTINTVMSKINNSGAGVTLSYDAAGERFVLTSTKEGSASNIAPMMRDAAKFFGALGIGKVVELTVPTGGDPTQITVPGLIMGSNDLKDLLDNMDGATGHAKTVTYVDDLGVTHSFGKVGTGDEFFHFYDDGSGMKVEYELDEYDNIVEDGQGNPVAKKFSSADIIAQYGGNLGVSGSREEGQNLIAMINGEKYVRQSNNFTHEGMNFNFTDVFNKERYVDGKFVDTEDLGTILDGNGNPVVFDPAIKVQVNKNTSEVVDSIKSFVEEYNKLVEHINGLLSEKRDRAYQPISDDDRKAMSEEDIKAYEDKAKAGLMRSDSELRKMLDQMRSAIYQRVEGVGLTMSEIGITTTSNWKDGGMLVIDEDKLTNAIETRYDEVVSLFTKPEVGVAQRLNTVLNDAVGTTGDKGYLLNKAGMVNDGTQYQNQIQKKLDEYDKRLDTLLDRWKRQEEKYYQMFARMESSMMKMQSQQNSLASLMAQGGN